MINWTIVGVISIVFNIVLLPLLFFKSALNEIMKEWWIDKRKKEEDAIKRLVDFKIKLNLYHGQNCLMMVTLAQKQSASRMGREVDSFIEDAFQSSSRKSGELSCSIAEFKDYLPVDLRTTLKRYQELWIDIIKKIMDGHITKEDLLGYNDMMSTVTNECIDLTDSMLRKKFD